ncbi:MAG: DUF5673 domain-containing protein [Wujia sp.]
MDVWIGVLAFVLFLGFGTAVLVCISAIKRQSGIIIRSRLHRKLNSSEIIYSNLGLILLAVLLYFHKYAFAPAILAFVLFVVLSTRIKSGITEEGAIVGTKFIDWEFMKSYKLVNDEEDSNVIILKIRADRRQYVLVCDRQDKEEIREIFEENDVPKTEVYRQ